MCVQSSFYHQLWINTWRSNSSKRQTVFFLPINPRDREHKDPEKIDLTVPRRAQYLHNAWKRYQDAVYWVDINLAIRKGLTFHQTRSNAIILQGTLPAYCFPKVVRLKTGEVLYEKAYMSPRLPPKISLKHEWTKEIGFRTCSTIRSRATISTDGPPFHSRLRHKEGRPHGHRYGKKPANKEYYIANQLKKVQEEVLPFQGIHVSFFRDEQFRSRMIENGRDEDLCRQMDALADEDHTHHLTPQEYFYYKCNWWLRSNKTGSDTVPVQRRSDFKQAFSALQQLKEKEEEAQQNQRWAQSSSFSSWWSWQGSWWAPYSYESHHGDEPST